VDAAAVNNSSFAGCCGSASEAFEEEYEHERTAILVW
jgi:hypothetical protein